MISRKKILRMIGSVLTFLMILYILKNKENLSFKDTLYAGLFFLALMSPFFLIEIIIRKIKKGRWLASDQEDEEEEKTIRFARNGFYEIINELGPFILKAIFVVIIITFFIMYLIYLYAKNKGLV
jgi:hypothetical protein